MATAHPAGQRPVAQLLAQLREAGLTQREIEQSTGMSARYQRFVAAGTKPGEHYRRSFERLLSTGTAAPAPRRRTKTGELAPVRGKAGQAARVPPPRPTAPSAVTPGQPGVVNTFFAGGRGRVRSVGVPRREGPDRVHARVEIYDAVLRASYGKRRIAFVVHWREPGGQIRSAELGSRAGYDARRVTGTIRWPPADGDVLRWLIEQGLRHRYDEIPAPRPRDIVQVDVITLPKPPR